MVPAIFENLFAKCFLFIVIVYSIFLLLSFIDKVNEISDRVGMASINHEIYVNLNELLWFVLGTCSSVRLHPPD